MNKLFVLSLGGSLFSGDNGPNTEFVKKLLIFLKRQAKQGNRFVIITGGGVVCRQYQHSLRKLRITNPSYLDWMGIYATRLNAEYLRLSLGAEAHSSIVIDPNKKINFKEKFLIAGGWMPGRSSDDDAVRLAKMYGSDYIVNLSNIDYLYDKDPNMHSDANLIKEITWKDYIKLVGNKWIPGAHVPFDPIASQFASKNSLNVIIANGNDLKNLSNIILGKKYKGTVIK